ATDAKSAHLKISMLGQTLLTRMYSPLIQNGENKLSTTQYPIRVKAALIQSDSDNPDDWTKSPQHPNCTSFAVTFNGGKFCGPHINSMPVTYEGIVTWNGHSTSIFPFGDDDYALNVKRDD